MFSSTRDRGSRKLLIAALLGLGVLTALSNPGRAFASFSGAERQGATAAVAPPSLALATPAAPTARRPRKAPAQHVTTRRHMAAQDDYHERRRAARRAFVGGLIVGIVTSRFRR